MSEIANKINLATGIVDFAIPLRIEYMSHEWFRPGTLDLVETQLKEEWKRRPWK